MTRPPQGNQQLLGALVRGAWLAALMPALATALLSVGCGEEATADEGYAGGSYCDYEGPEPESPELPCDIARIVSDYCERCHVSPAVSGCGQGYESCARAPFALGSWEAFQAVRLRERVYAQTTRIVEARGMPMLREMDPPVAPMPPEDTEALLEWTRACAPPARAGQQCR